jgi:hypothetical protein
LRAVPAGSIPADLSPFSGPVAAIGQSDVFSFGDFYTYAQQLTAADDYGSAGACGYCDGYLFDPDFANTTTTFFGNDWFDNLDARSGIQVDGANAYPPARATFINGSATGRPSMTYSYSLDPSNGDFEIDESDPIVKCPMTTYPPDATSCPSFSTTGVRLDRTISQESDGHLVFVTDTWTSTDAAMHTVDLQPINSQSFGGNAPMVAYRFPGEGSFTTHAPDDVVTFSPDLPGGIFVNVQGSPDGAHDTGQGAIVFDRAASPATFYEGFPGSSAMYLQQSGTVPAGSSTTFRYAYAQAYTCAEVAALAQTAASRFGGSVSSPCPSPPPAGGGAAPAPGPTGQRARALKKCKKKKSAKARKKCRKRAKKLPV